MKKYRVTYTFQGDGSVTMEAKNEKDAQKKWRDGDYEEEEENANDFQFESVQEIENK